MTDLSLRHNVTRDLAPLRTLLTDEGDLALVNPSAKHPFDPLEWQEKWLADLDDESFYILDATGAEVGFFALRPGVGPEMRHLAYVYLSPEQRGGSGARVAELAEEAAKSLGAALVTLKVEVENEPAVNTYKAAGYEEVARNDNMATMMREVD
ncbi:GNAT family N-acetyltransferase [Oceaniglobus roseus]|uniref:GNAT family N-acetyltransferase n=1 Tax=Oceaniglobus roseus TaxID=1737570 RepID=UPI000C7F3D5C|nr:GNAT family N-acetyltransferase [Kandeliimicrobium roseum]